MLYYGFKAIVYIVVVDLNEFHNSFEKCNFSTPDIRKQSQTSLEWITLKGRLGVSNEWSLEGAVYKNLW